MSEVTRKTMTALITSEFLQLVEPRIAELICSRMIARERHVENHLWYKSLNMFLYIIMLFVLFGGLILGAYSTFFDQSMCRSLWLSLVLMLICLILLYGFRSLRRFNSWMLPINHTKLSKKLAHRLLKTAKKIVPYVAEYEFKNDLVTYYRIKNNSAVLAWSRKLPAVKVEGEGFILYFGKEHYAHPQVIILCP